MNNQVNYTMVGFFVLLGMLLAGLFGYWLLKPSDETKVQRYIIYFDESVLGLNLDAPVKYKGLNVGKVIKLGINKSNTEQIEVLVEVQSATPIKTSTVAQLTSQGITGLSYVNLSFGEDENAQVLVAKNDERYPVIKTVPSLLIKLENTFSDISINIAKTLEKAQELLSSQNQKEFSKLLKNSTTLVDKMNKTLDEKTIKNIQTTFQNLDNSSKKLDEMMPKVLNLVEKTTLWEDSISTSFKSIMGSYLGIKNSMDIFKKSIESGSFDVKDMTSDVLPAMNNTFLEMQQLMIKIEQTLLKYEKSPADAIFTQEEIKKGPGEE